MNLTGQQETQSLQKKNLHRQRASPMRQQPLIQRPEMETSLAKMMMSLPLFPESF